MFNWELVPDWKNWPKWFSTWFEGLTLAFFFVINTMPELVLDVWMKLPSSLQDTIPVTWLKWFVILFVVLGSFSKIIEQRKLKK